MCPAVATKAKTILEKEDFAVQLMVAQQMKPKKALEIAGLDYKAGGKDYNRVVGKRRRGDSTKAKKKRRRVQQVITN